MKRLTFDGNYCDIAQCDETRGGSFCEDGACSQRKVWERLKEWEDLEEQGRVIVMQNPEQDGMARLRELADADRDGRVLVLSEAMEDVSALGVAPVRHGRWIDKGEYAVCTECGGRSGTQYDGVEPIPLMTQFCPNCGCRMDGGDDE